MNGFTFFKASDDELLLILWESAFTGYGFAIGAYATSGYEPFDYDGILRIELVAYVVPGNLNYIKFGFVSPFWTKVAGLATWSTGFSIGLISGFGLLMLYYFNSSSFDELLRFSLKNELYWEASWGD